MSVEDPNGPIKVTARKQIALKMKENMGKKPWMIP